MIVNLDGSLTEQHKKHELILCISKYLDSYYQPTYNRSPASCISPNSEHRGLAVTFHGNKVRAVQSKFFLDQLGEYDRNPDSAYLQHIYKFWQVFKYLCNIHHIRLYPEQEKLTKQEQFLLYLSPMIREELWSLDISLWSAIHSPRIHPAIFAPTFKESVREITGTQTPKILKAVGKMIYISSNQRVMHRSPYAHSVAGTFTADDCCDVSSASNYSDTYIVFQRTEINTAIYDFLFFACRFFPLSYVYEMLDAYYRTNARPFHINDRFIYPDSQQVRRCAAFFKERHPPKKMLKMLSGEPTDFSYLEDIRTQYEAFKTPESIPEKLKSKYPDGLLYPKKTKGLREIHDKISAQYREIQAEANNKKIKYSNKLAKLDGLQIDGFKFILPHETKTLVSWGREMKNCIASYGNRAVSGDSLLVGVEVGGKLTYNIEIGMIRVYVGSIDKAKESDTKVDIRQFLGQSNSKPAQDIRDRIYAILQEALVERKAAS